MGLGELQACPFPNVVCPPLLLSALSSSSFHGAVQDGFGQTWYISLLLVIFIVPIYLLLCLCLSLFSVDTSVLLCLSLSLSLSVDLPISLGKQPTIIFMLIVPLLLSSFMPLGLCVCLSPYRSLPVSMCTCLSPYPPRSKLFVNSHTSRSSLSLLYYDSVSVCVPNPRLTQSFYMLVLLSISLTPLPW